MSGNQAFSETQQFQQKWIFAIFIAIMVVLAALTIYTFLHHEQDFWILGLAVIAMGLLLMLFKRMALYLSVNAQSISYRFSPFQWKDKVIAKDEIRSISVVTYSPIGDYGGWGIRLGTKGSAYTVSGNRGICIELTSSKQLLIGTSKPTEIDVFLHRYWPDKMTDKK